MINVHLQQKNPPLSSNGATLCGIPIHHGSSSEPRTPKGTKWESGDRWAIYRDGADRREDVCMVCQREYDAVEHHEYCDVNDPIIKTKPCNCRGRRCDE